MADKIDWKKQITIPNLITLVRLLLIPVMAVEIYRSKGYSRLSMILYLAIWLTDILDGWIARTFNQESKLGALLDPVVDKIFHLTTAIMLCLVGRIPLWVPLALGIKELIMVVGATFLLASNDLVIPARWYGKLGTVLLAVGFSLVFIMPPEHQELLDQLFIIPVVMAYFSLFSYAKSVYDMYKAGEVELKNARKPKQE